MKFFSKLLSVGVLLATPFAALTASATPILGSFTLNGTSGSYVTGSAPSYANGGTAATATGLDFGILNSASGAGNGMGVNGTASIANAKGSFAGLTMASISDISLIGNVANPYTANPFISFTGSNIVVNFSNATVTRSGTGTSLTVAGIATFTDGVAADATSGNFSLSANSQSGLPSDISFSFTSNVSASATPEPSSLALLGTGIVSLGGLVRRRIVRA